MCFFESPPLILGVILPVEIRYSTFGGHGGSGMSDKGEENDGTRTNPWGKTGSRGEKFICLRGELGTCMGKLLGAFWPRAAAAFPHLTIERLGRGVQRRRSSRAGVQRLAV